MQKRDISIHVFASMQRQWPKLSNITVPSGPLVLRREYGTTLHMGIEMRISFMQRYFPLPCLISGRSISHSPFTFQMDMCFLWKADTCGVFFNVNVNPKKTVTSYAASCGHGAICPVTTMVPLKPFATIPWASILYHDY